MNRLRLLLFVVILGISFGGLYVSGEPNGETSLRVVYLRRAPDNLRPEAPQHSCIGCEYSETKIEIEIPADIEYLTVTITEKGCVIHESVVAIDEPVVQTDLLPGRYGITCTTPEGVCYQGDLVL